MATLQEIMARYGGCTERLPEGEYRSGMEVSLAGLVEKLDEWKKVWDQLEPRMVDQRRHREQRQLQQALGRHAPALEDMTFQLKVHEGYSKKSIREQLLRENPGQENMIKDIFRPDAWWLLIARTRANDGSDYLDFCHANTRNVVRLKVGADSPIVDAYALAGPAKPHGAVTVFQEEET